MCVSYRVRTDGSVAFRPSHAIRELVGWVGATALMGCAAWGADEDLLIAPGDESVCEPGADGGECEWTAAPISEAAGCDTTGVVPMSKLAELETTTRGTFAPVMVGVPASPAAEAPESVEITYRVDMELHDEVRGGLLVGGSRRERPRATADLWRDLRSRWRERRAERRARRLARRDESP